MICSVDLLIQGCWNLGHSFPQHLAPVQALLLPPFSNSSELARILSYGPAIKAVSTLLMLSGLLLPIQSWWYSSLKSYVFFSSYPYFSLTQGSMILIIFLSPVLRV